MTRDTPAVRLRLPSCDVTHSAIAKIEVGQRHLYPDEILLIRQVLNVTYDEIFALTAICPSGASAADTPIRMRLRPKAAS